MGHIWKRDEPNIYLFDGWKCSICGETYSGPNIPTPGYKSPHWVPETGIILSYSCEEWICKEILEG